MKVLHHIQPRFIIAITVAITVLMALSAFIELRQSRQELYHVMEEEALSLIEAIGRSSHTTILATDQIEGQLAERLLNNAYFIARLDSLGVLTDEQLETFAAANDVYRINVFDRKGRRILTSYTPHSEHARLEAKHSPIEYIKPILEGTTDRLVIGMKEARYTDEFRFAVAVRRTARGGGAIVLNLNAADLLGFRKKVGIGRLMQDLGDNSGVEYVALQDSEGIIAASRRVQELSSFHEDPVLPMLSSHDSSVARTIQFEGREVFEVLRPLKVNDALLGVLRVGLSMDEIHATENRMTRRMAIMSLILVAVGALVLTAIVINQNYRLARQKLAAVQTFTGSVLEHMQDAVVTVSADGRVDLFNKRAQELFGVSDDAVIGKPLLELNNGAAACLGQLFAATSTETEQKIVCGNGSEKTVAISFSTAYGKGGKEESRTAVIRDLTEARRLQQEIERKEKLSAMGELASGVAHEIRNPLNAIAMIAQRLEAEFTPQNDAGEYHSLSRVLKSEAHRVNTIIQQFLRFARPPKANCKPVPVEEFITHISSLFEGQARGKGLHFVAESTSHALLTIDPELMTQALLNLLQNALDATPPGGTITLRCTSSDTLVCISVKDTGTGIPAENVDKIFNLYYSTKPNGTGLGLAITHQIVSEHHGYIAVNSRVGGGTQLDVYLPFESS